MSFEITGLREYYQYLEFIAEDIPNEMSKLTSKTLRNLKNRMKTKTSKHKFSQGMGVSVTDSFVIYTLYKNKDSHGKVLTNIAPHAIMLEQGVSAHFVTIDNYEKLKEWVSLRYNSIEPKSILIGGSRSAIQKGNSKRRFFEPTIDEYLVTGAVDKDFAEAIENSLNKTYK